MELTAVQLRTLSGLIEVGPGRPFEPGIDGRLRRRIEEGIAPHLPASPLRLWKERLNEAARCQGLLGAALAGQRPPFRHGPASASGTVLHRAIEMEVWAGDGFEATELAERAAESLRGDRQFGPYWDDLDAIGRGEVLMRAVQGLESFRASFPPLHAHRRSLAPVCEQWLEASFGDGLVTVVGRVDLMVNPPRPDAATRVLIDLKGGRGSGDHPEDMRLYALLYTFRTGVPPARVATFFPHAGGWQPEDVDERILEHAADRVIGVVRTLARLALGEDPELTPGPHCGRCPVRDACPVAAREAGP